MANKITVFTIESPNIVKKHLTNGQYRTQMYPKHSIFLHHTAGSSAQSAWDWWNKTPERVGTPYIIDRDGTIYETFNPMMWAPHLGVKGQIDLDQNSIGIEIVSWGQLKEKNGKYFTYTNKEIPLEEVAWCNWRGEKFFQAYSKAQIQSLLNLLAKLKKDFPSLVLNNPIKGFHEYSIKVTQDNVPGLWSHTTVRKDKLDIFPQNGLIEALIFFKKSLPNTILQ